MDILVKKPSVPASERELQTNKLMLGFNQEEDEPVILLVTDNFIIRDINETGAYEFFKKNKQEVVNHSLIDLLLAQHIDTKEFLKAFKHNQKQSFKYIQLQHGLSGKKYSVTIVALHRASRTDYAITMMARDNSHVFKYYMSAIINNLPGSVYWKDLDGHYLGCNKFVATMAGFDSTDDIIGKTDYDLCWKEFAEDWRLLDKQVIKENKTIAHEEKVKLANENIITELTYKTPLKNEHDEIIGIIGTSLDITDRKVMEAALHKSQIAAEAANRAKTEFIANMSHDIRTPLSGIVGMSQLLEESVTKPEHKQFARWLYESGEQLLGMLNGILDIVSADNVSENDRREESFDVRQCIQEIIQLERPTTRLKNLVLQFDVDEDVPFYIVSDRTKIHRILLNLLGNAIKFTEQGLISIEVKSLSRSTETTQLRFSVTDTGIGIPVDHQDKVFDRFFRISPSSKGIYAGHGVGLHIAKSYVELLGGEIKLISQEKVGTTFYFDLTFKIGKKPTSLKTITTAPEIKPIKRKDTPRLLLVEDNIVALHMIESMASKFDCNYTSASDGEHALELAKSKDFDIIISDIGLPGISGHELARRIRKNEVSLNKKSVPIIGLSAHAREQAKEECLEAGMNDVFTKPVNLEIMQRILKQYLSQDTPPNKPEDKSASQAPSKLGHDLPDTEAELFELAAFPLLDIKNASESMGGESMLREILLLMVKQEIPRDIEAIKKAYSEKNWKEIEGIAHKMKGGTVYCGTVRMQYACQYLERYQKAGYSAMLEKLYHQLIDVTQETKLVVEQWLDKAE